MGNMKCSTLCISRIRSLFSAPAQQHYFVEVMMVEPLYNIDSSDPPHMAIDSDSVLNLDC
jgi:hypothetical protein